MPRTGSTLLLTTLQQHSGILAFSELFHPELRERAGSHAIRRNAAAIYFDPSGGTALEFLENWVWCSNNNAHSAVGFKVFGDYLKHASTEGLFVDLKQKIRNLHVIHIKRLNYLDVYVSRMVASKTGVWIKMHDGTHSNQAEEQELRIRINPIEAEKFFLSMTEADGFFERNFGGGKYLPVYYEKIATDLQNEANRIFDFMGVGEQPVRAYLKKQISRRKNDLIENYGDLLSYFAGSRFAAYFDN